MNDSRLRILVALESSGPGGAENMVVSLAAGLAAALRIALRGAASPSLGADDRPDCA